jgi:energy-coupling factor transporter ATP-binding protein EcfA2
MYLRSITLKNTGPIRELNLVLPFEGENPKPLLLVGRNGSGKSTLISFVVNALVALKQQIYEDVEIDKGRVYRIRSPLGIHGDARYYFAKIEFEKGASLIEWQFNDAREVLTDFAELQNLDGSFQEIPATETSYFKLPLGELTAPHLLEATLQKNSYLFFPADRFEPPDWLNIESLSSELQLPEQSRMKGKTSRRIFFRNRLKPTLDWLHSVIFDMMVSEHVGHSIIPSGSETPVNVRLATPGKAHAVFSAVHAVLQKTLCRSIDEKLELGIGHRNQRIITATVRKNGEVVRIVKDLLSLSAGESALFCMFASIIRDADMSLMEFQLASDITGIVVIDEADLHLHMGLQFEVLPELIKLFPKVQFIISVHAPLVALGMDKSFGAAQFELREMPTGEMIGPESYTEFLSAFDVFSETRAFQKFVINQIQSGTRPAILVEGKTDALHLQTAWSKLNPDLEIPYDLIACGKDADASKRSGGAKVLQQCLSHIPLVSDRRVVGVFDNDREGAGQFGGLTSKNAGFTSGLDDYHRKHIDKPVHAILLPTPVGREAFTSSLKIEHRYLEIEHYFSDIVLERHSIKGAPILPGTSIFEIEAASGKKSSFSNAATSFESSEFENFKNLFSRISQVLS